MLICKNTSHFWLASKAIAKRIHYSGNSPEDHLWYLFFFFFSFSDPVKSLKTKSGSILRHVNVFERGKVGGSRLLNVRCWQHKVRVI